MSYRSKKPKKFAFAKKAVLGVLAFLVATILVLTGKQALIGTSRVEKAVESSSQASSSSKKGSSDVKVNLVSTKKTKDSSSESSSSESSSSVEGESIESSSTESSSDFVSSVNSVSSVESSENSSVPVSSSVTEVAETVPANDTSYSTAYSLTPSEQVTYSEPVAPVYSEPSYSPNSNVSSYTYSLANGNTAGAIGSEAAAQMAAATGVPQSTWEYIIARESNGDPNAYNVSGASGLFQTMPGWGSTATVQDQINAAINAYNAQGLSAWGMQ